MLSSNFVDLILQNLLRTKTDAQNYLSRVFAETFATDSYQNILFSILLYSRVCGYHPSMLTIVTHAFKARRFSELHLPALRWCPPTMPATRTQFKCIDPPEAVTPKKILEEGEAKNGFALWEKDPYGVGKAIGKKKEARGWSESTVKEIHQKYMGVPGNEENDEMIKLLLRWRGGRDRQLIFPGRLPWDGRKDGLTYDAMKALVELGADQNG